MQYSMKAGFPRRLFEDYVQGFTLDFFRMDLFYVQKFYKNKRTVVLKG